MSERPSRRYAIAWEGGNGGSALLRDLESHQLQRFETRVAVLADDEVVVHGDAEGPRDLDDRSRHVDVGARRGGIAGGMVVHQDDAVAESSSARLTTSRG